MRLYIIIAILAGIGCSCEKRDQANSHTSQVEKSRYYEEEILPDQYLDLYGTWEIQSISGGFAGTGYEVNFDYLEIKEYGIYGFVRNDSLLEYGKIEPAAMLANEVGYKITFTRDEQSDTFFTDPIKYVTIRGSDTLDLNAPCCDRFNYHFLRIN